MEKIGVVSKYFEHARAAAVKLTEKLKVGDTIQIKGGDVEIEQEITSMQINREDMEEAGAGDEVGILVKQKVRKGYKVWKV